MIKLSQSTSVLILLWFLVASHTALGKVEADDQTRDEQCPSNYVAASQSGKYVVYFGNSGEEDCCTRNELAQACGLNVFCADVNSPNNASSSESETNSKNAFTTYSNCETAQEILLGYDGQESTLNCDDAITYLFDASEQYGCNSNEFKLARRDALNECGSKAYLCMVKKGGGVCGETTNLTRSDGVQPPSSDEECPSSYRDATNSSMVPIYLGRSDGDDKNVTCCDKYSLEQSCGIDVLCANPAVYNNSRKYIESVRSCTIIGTKLL